MKKSRENPPNIWWNGKFALSLPQKHKIRNIWAKKYRQEKNCYLEWKLQKKESVSALLKWKCVHANCSRKELAMNPNMFIRYNPLDIDESTNHRAALIAVGSLLYVRPPSTVPPLFLHCSSTPSLLNHWTYTGVTLDLHWSSTALTLTPLLSFDKCPCVTALQRYSGIPDP